MNSLYNTFFNNMDGFASIFLGLTLSCLPRLQGGTTARFLNSSVVIRAPMVSFAKYFAKKDG